MPPTRATAPTSTRIKNPVCDFLWTGGRIPAVSNSGPDSSLLATVSLRLGLPRFYEYSLELTFYRFQTVEILRRFLAKKTVHHRNHKQSGHGCQEQAADDGPAERGVLLATFAQ